MKAPKFSEIPVPDNTVESLVRSMLGVISTLSVLTGTGAKSKTGIQTNRNMAHVFVQDTPPEALNDGDLWLCQAPKISLSCWNGDRWVHLVDAV